jgi:AraC family transcriptional regulator of adaptative response/methylated-DNA-[protein]-cysteine methyltransferase
LQGKEFAVSNPESVRSDERMWQAVVCRDPDYTRHFVYGVLSTGIYCRPGCPSRLPNRSNVRFFLKPAEAEGMGLRPCRRCGPSGLAGKQKQIEMVSRVCAYLDTRTDETPSLEELGRLVSTSPWHLQRTFTRLVGISPRQYVQAKRLGRFKRQLKKWNVLQALYEAGYGSTSRVYEAGKASLGMTPATYRKGGEGARINFAIVDSPLGYILVAATSRGICRISIGSEKRELSADLTREFPRAEITRDEKRIAPLARKVIGLLEGKLPHRDLPIDVRATAFQWNVWRLLMEIPHGETRSYGEVAKSLGRPTAARAVARACASNPVALAIPCHRVIAGDGGLGGYRWGVERKREILDREKTGVSPSRRTTKRK